MNSVNNITRKEEESFQKYYGDLSWDNFKVGREQLIKIQIFLKKRIRKDQLARLPTQYLNDNTIQMAITALGKKSIINIVETNSTKLHSFIFLDTSQMINYLPVFMTNLMFFLHYLSLTHNSVNHNFSHIYLKPQTCHWRWLSLLIISQWHSR